MILIRISPNLILGGLHHHVYHLRGPHTSKLTIIRSHLLHQIIRKQFLLVILMPIKVSLHHPYCNRKRAIVPRRAYPRTFLACIQEQRYQCHNNRFHHIMKEAFILAQTRAFLAPIQRQRLYSHPHHPLHHITKQIIIRM